MSNFIYFAGDVMDINKSMGPRFLEIKINDILPETLSFSYSPKYSEQAIIGRLSPIQIYSGGSNKIYSFTVTLHEDALLGSGYMRLTDIVDDIKSLSYPYYNEERMLNRPAIYFEIGEISGRGIINTAHAWKKPFRDGRYIVVDISFNVTLVEIFSAPTLVVNEKSIVYNGPTLVYYDKVKLTSSDMLKYTKQAATDVDNAYNNYLTSNNNAFKNIYFYTYDGYADNDAYSDFVVFGDSAYEVNLGISNTIKYFEELSAVSSAVIGAMGDVNLENEDISTYISQLSDLSSSFTMSSLRSIIGSSTNSVANKIKELETLRDAFEQLLDYYYDNVDRDMTRDEYDLILGSFEAKLEKLEDMYRTVSGYAPSN